MREAGRDRQFERLYTQLLARAEQLHQSNKRRIRRGLIGLIVLPFILCFILWVTGSSKIVFLIVWVVLMFIMSAYLITIEYMDDFIQKTLNEMSEKETDFGDLLEREPLQERIAERLSGIRSMREDLRADIRARLTGGSEDDNEEDSSKQITSEDDQADFYIDTVNTIEKSLNKEVRNGDAISDTTQSTEDSEVSASEQTGDDSTGSGFDEAALLAVLAGSTESADEGDDRKEPEPNNEEAGV